MLKCMYVQLSLNGITYHMFNSWLKSFSKVCSGASRKNNSSRKK